MIALLSLAILPWMVIAAVTAFAVRMPPRLPRPEADRPRGGEELPSVRIVVPARNEELNIGPCLRSLSRQAYPGFGITVVDDRSTDDTRRLALAVPPGNARSIEVVMGEPLPAGWFGKCWACAQGAREAREDLLLFTDADTIHEPGLLHLAVRALLEDEASAVSLLGRQELGSFGERLVQPQIFTLLGLRFRKLGRHLGREQQRDAMANGQFILVRRIAYQEIGGHGSVRSEVVEDLRLAQVLTGAGHRLSVRLAEHGLSTRMYRSLGEVLDGWTKNLAIGASQSGGPWGRLAPAAILGYAVLIWVLPPAVLLALGTSAVFGAYRPGAALAWSTLVVATGLVVWVGKYRRYGVSWGYAFLYPIGAAVLGLIALRSGWRGHRRVEWKGRRYMNGEVLGGSE